MIRTVRELLDEIENQVGDHDESETPVVVVPASNTASGRELGIHYLEFFNDVLEVHVA